MRVAFSLDAENVIECHWSALSGSERYLHNGHEVLRLRSFSVTGSRELNLEIDGQPRQVNIELCFQPALKSLIRNNGFVMRVHVDGELYVENLFDPEYRVTTPWGRVFKTIIGFLLGVLLLLGVDAYLFDGALLDLPTPPLSDKLLLINAALGTPECHDTLDDHDSMLVVPLRKAGALRSQEMKRTNGWRLEQGETRLSALSALHWGVSAACQASVRELLLAYLKNGAALEQRSDFPPMTPLGSAIMGGDKALTCLLLEQGASLKERVTWKRHDGSDAPITGKTLYELAQYQAAESDTTTNREILALIERFLAHGRCGEPSESAK
jgi:hypothetical protein